MFKALTVKHDKDRVGLFEGPTRLADFPAGEAEELAMAIKCGAKLEADGWYYQDGRLKVGLGKDRLVVLCDGKPIVNVPKSAALTLAAAIRQQAKIARHWELLNHTTSRERLYEDQQLIINAGFRNLRLGVPNPELKTMGGVPSREFIGLPSLIGHPTSVKDKSNGNDRTG